MSTAARVVSTSCDFDDSVFASRLSSCIRKSRRRPAGSVASSTLQGLGDVAAEAVEFLLDVHLVGEQHEFLLEALRDRPGVPSCATRSATLRPDARAHLRQPRPHQRRRSASRRLAALYAASRGCARPRVRARRSGRRTVSPHAASSASPATGVRSRSASRITPGQRSMSSALIGPADATQHAADVAARLQQLLDQRAIELERCASTPPSTAQVQARVDLAAAQAAADSSWRDVALEAAQVLGQPQRDLEVAVIDRAQLAASGCPRGPGARVAQSPSCCGSLGFRAELLGQTTGRRAHATYRDAARDVIKSPRVYIRSRRAGATLAHRARGSEPPRESRRKPGSCRQSRSATAAALLAVVDGMGGHADGARAAEAAIRSMVGDFWEAQPAAVRPRRVPAPDDRPRTRRRRGARARAAAGNPAPRHLRRLPRAGLERVLGPRRRQPHLPAACRRGRRPHPRPQPRRTAAARRPHHRAAGAGPPDAQLRRVLHRRRSGAARDVAQRPQRAQVRRRAAAVLGRALVRPHRRADRVARASEPGQ